MHSIVVFLSKQYMLEIMRLLFYILSTNKYFTLYMQNCSHIWSDLKKWLRLRTYHPPIYIYVCVSTKMISTSIANFTLYTTSYAQILKIVWIQGMLKTFEYLYFLLNLIPKIWSAKIPNIRIYSQNPFWSKKAFSTL